ncbi:MAG: hypothetical protein MJZ33_02905 [Paludibacteraceae bacterium]|nr:hypothetical protein [Paludibacteraceae bacterium]
MKRQLESIGLPDNNQNRSYIQEKIIESYNNTSSIVPLQNGTVRRDVLIMGSNGGILLQTFWRGSHLNTIIILGGK